MMSNVTEKKYAMIAIILTLATWCNVMIIAFDLNHILPRAHSPTPMTSFARRDRMNNPIKWSNNEWQLDFFCARTNCITTRRKSIGDTKLLMGIGDFFKGKGSDFVKLESTENSYGPGPVILFFNVPNGISDEELSDMIEDGAPLASKAVGGVKYRRYATEDLFGTLADGTVSQTLELALRESPEKSEDRSLNSAIMTSEKPVTRIIGTIDSDIDEFNDNVSIIYFSGITNTEMMQTYKILAREIFDESGGLAACAKAVEPAMSKSFRQLMTEIAADHSDATGGSNRSNE